MIFNKNVSDKRKNHKIQLYVDELIEGAKPAQHRKLYLYSNSQFNSNGLWAYVRDSSSTEQMNDSKLSAIFVINYNEKIIKESRPIYIEFKNNASRKNEVYQVLGKPDRYEYGINDIKLNTELKTDDTVYNSIGFLED